MLVSPATSMMVVLILSARRSAGYAVAPRTRNRVVPSMMTGAVSTGGAVGPAAGCCARAAGGAARNAIASIAATSGVAALRSSRDKSLVIIASLSCGRVRGLRVRLRAWLPQQVPQLGQIFFQRSGVEHCDVLAGTNQAFVEQPRQGGEAGGALGTDPPVAPLPGLGQDALDIRFGHGHGAAAALAHDLQHTEMADAAIAEVAPTARTAFGRPMRFAISP